MDFADTSYQRRRANEGSLFIFCRNCHECCGGHLPWQSRSHPRIFYNNLLCIYRYGSRREQCRKDRCG